MKVALIRLNLQKKCNDWKPDFSATVIIKTTSTEANKYKPDRKDLLALSESQFKKRFPKRDFPKNLITFDTVLLQWMNTITQSKLNTKIRAKKNNSLMGAYILAETITIAKDSTGLQIESVAAIGDSVYIKCDNADRDILPPPTVLLAAANHYFLHQYCLFTETEFKSLVKNNYGLQWVTTNKGLNSIKEKLDKGDDKPLLEPPVKASDVLKPTKNTTLTDSQLVSFSTKLPQKVIELIKDVSNTEHISMARVITNCIISKYGQN